MHCTRPEWKLLRDRFSACAENYYTLLIAAAFVIDRNGAAGMKTYF
jgi:hypothetical protein